jgi:hypothetical protein
MPVLVGKLPVLWDTGSHHVDCRRPEPASAQPRAQGGTASPLSSCGGCPLSAALGRARLCSRGRAVRASSFSQAYHQTTGLRWGQHAVPELGNFGVLQDGARVERLLVDGDPTEDLQVLKDVDVAP